eukprot:TRINITY_DN36826_c0_g1_i1.p1 TRINITY_DN36826_c0_g1~~TRINITY_DN36826_c0_g1_i1.p1  ORF type:complete len:162 (+),score=29.33 TRINITY_DN36826_c0_g1_i1:262-747(+)
MDRFQEKMKQFDKSQTPTEQLQPQAEQREVEPVQVQQLVDGQPGLSPTEGPERPSPDPIVMAVARDEMATDPPTSLLADSGRESAATDTAVCVLAGANADLGAVVQAEESAVVGEPQEPAGASVKDGTTSDRKVEEEPQADGGQPEEKVAKKVGIWGLLGY